MSMFTWPWRLLMPTEQRTRPRGSAVNSGPSLTGMIQASDAAGGGLWRSDFQSIQLMSASSIKCARAWAAFMDEGATQFILPVFDLGFAPRPITAGGYSLPGAPFQSDDFFAQDPSFGSPLISAVIVGPFALRATILKILMVVGTPLRGGEHFSIKHPDKGWRIYRVVRVISADGAGQTVEIRTPLRQALLGGEACEFDVPRFQAMLVPDKADDIEPLIKLGKTATINGYFMEAFTGGA